MIDQDVAERLKIIIRENGGYDKVSDLTNLNRQTLIRICTGKTDPKLSQVVAIINLSNSTINEIIYGKEHAATNESLVQFERDEMERRSVSESVSEQIMNFKKHLLEKLYSVERDVRKLQKIVDSQSEVIEQLNSKK